MMCRVAAKPRAHHAARTAYGAAETPSGPAVRESRTTCAMCWNGSTCWTVCSHSGSRSAGRLIGENINAMKTMSWVTGPESVPAEVYTAGVEAILGREHPE